MLAPRNITCRQTPLMWTDNRSTTLPTMPSSNSTSSVTITLLEVAKTIDHCLLRRAMSQAEVRKGLEIAWVYNVASVSIRLDQTTMGLQLPTMSRVLFSIVIGLLPHASSSMDLYKLFPPVDAESRGFEVEMLVDTAKTVQGNYIAVQKEIRHVNQTVTGLGGKLKVIIELDYLRDEHIIQLCKICSRLKVAFVSVSTGSGDLGQPFGLKAGKVPFRQLELMRQHLDEWVQLKTANEIRSLDDLLHLKSLGVDRVTTTHTEEILEEARMRGIGHEPTTVGFEPIGSRPPFSLTTVWPTDEQRMAHEAFESKLMERWIWWL